MSTRRLKRPDPRLSQARPHGRGDAQYNNWHVNDLGGGVRPVKFSRGIQYAEERAPSSFSRDDGGKRQSTGPALQLLRGFILAMHGSYGPGLWFIKDTAFPIRMAGAHHAGKLGGGDASALAMDWTSAW